MIWQYLLLALSLIIWCAIHSATISGPMVARLQARMGTATRYYRLLYNALAIATFIPVMAHAGMLQTPPLFAWTGGLRVVQIVLLATALLFFLFTARRYDLRQLIGWSQVRGDTSGKGIAASGTLDTAGPLSVVRHPMYFATALLIWARPLDVSAIIVNTVLTAYLVVGTLLEERRLVVEFGKAYRNYQQAVPMLVPYKVVTRLFQAGRRTVGDEGPRV